MSDPRLEQLRGGIDAFNRGDAEPGLGLFSDDVVCVVGPNLMNSGTYIGPEGYLEMVANWSEAWDSVNAEPVSIEDLPNDHLLVEIHQRAVGAGSGVPVAMTIWWVFGFRDGKVNRFHMYGDRAAAVAVASE